MRYLYLLSTIFFLVVTNQLQAASIGLGDFSGSENVVSLAFLPGSNEPVVTVGSLTFTSDSNFLKSSGLAETSSAGVFTMDLATPQQRVGLELNAFSGATGGAAVTWSVEALDASLNSLETILLSQTAASAPVFGGIERAEGIAQLVVTEVTPAPLNSNYFTFIREVRFELPVPEPAAITMLTLGLILSSGLGRRTQRCLT